MYSCPAMAGAAREASWPLAAAPSGACALAELPCAPCQNSSLLPLAPAPAALCSEAVPAARALSRAMGCVPAGLLVLAYHRMTQHGVQLVFLWSTWAMMCRGAHITVVLHPVPFAFCLQAIAATANMALATWPTPRGKRARGH